MKTKILKRSFFARDTVEVAKDLLGKKLVRVIDGKYLVGIINEVEAYRSDDPASHSYKGRTERNKSMFGTLGHAYVYFTYGMHFCLNVVARDVNSFPAGGVLIRSVIPIEGLEIIKSNRKIKTLSTLTNGPAKLTQAFDVKRKHDGIDLTDPNNELFITQGYDINEDCIKATSRIGISLATDKLWRFLISTECLNNLLKNIQT